LTLNDSNKPTPISATTLAANSNSLKQKGKNKIKSIEIVLTHVMLSSRLRLVNIYAWWMSYSIGNISLTKPYLTKAIL
jgi:hypothetical protein